MSNAPSLTPKDVRDQVEDTCKALRAFAETVIAVAIGGETTDGAGPVSLKAASTQRISAELALDDFRSVLVEALTGAMPPSYVNSTDLAKALTGRFEDNDIAAGRRPASPLSTAMRRADEAERAERRAIADAHARGESICAALGLDLPLTLRGSL